VVENYEFATISRLFSETVQADAKVTTEREYEVIHTVSQKTSKIIFCYNYVKLPPNLTIFGTKMASILWFRLNVKPLKYSTLKCTTADKFLSAFSSNNGFSKEDDILIKNLRQLKG